jgi:hypothetical protein
LVDIIEKEGLPFRVFETQRTFTRSHTLFLQGRNLRADGSIIITDQSKIVTKARAGESPHGWLVALDCVLVTDRAHAFWSDEDPNDAPKGPWDTGYEHGRLVRPHVKMAWSRYGQAVVKAGLVWGGSWSWPDMPHAEVADWKNYRPASWKEVVARALEAGH